MDIRIAIGKVYVTENKVEIYIQSSFQNELKDLDKIPIFLIIFAPKNDEEKLLLELMFTKLRGR